MWNYLNSKLFYGMETYCTDRNTYTFKGISLCDANVRQTIYPDGTVRAYRIITKDNSL